MTQIKFTIDSEIVSNFKTRCAKEGISMASVVSEFMKTGRPSKSVKIKTETRPYRKKAICEIIGMLGNILQKEEEYRDAIPEHFTSRQETSDETCNQLSEAISCLENAYI